MPANIRIFQVFPSVICESLTLTSELQTDWFFVFVAIYISGSKESIMTLVSLRTWVRLGKPNRFCELPTAGYAHFLVASDNLVCQLTMWCGSINCKDIGFVLLKCYRKDAHKCDGLFVIGSSTRDCRTSAIFPASGGKILSWKTVQR